MVRYLFYTAWSPATTTNYKRLFTENRHIPTITRPVFVQPDLSQGYYYPDSDERAQLVCADSPDSLQDETDYLSNVFSKNNYNTDFV